MNRSASRWTNICIGVVASMLTLAWAAVGVGRVLASFDHNEQMYVSAGILVARGSQIYTDFAYLQTPLLPLIYGWLFRITESQDFLLVAKMVSVAAYLLAALVLGRITWRLCRSRTCSIAAAGLLLSSSLFGRVAAEASNYVLPLLAALLAIDLWLSGLAVIESRATSQTAARRGPWWRFFASGLFIGVAASLKSYYVLLAVAFALTALSLRWPAPRHSLVWRLREVVAPHGVGLCTGLIPVAWYAWIDWDRFVFFNLEFHSLTTRWKLGPRSFQEIAIAKFEAFYAHFLAKPDSLALFVSLALIGWLGFQSLRNGRLSTDPIGRSALLLVAWLLAFGLLAALLPAPSYVQHYSLPSTLALVFFVVLMSTAPLSPSIPRAWPVVALLVITTAFRFDAMKAGSQGSWSPDRWASTRIAAEARLISDALPATAHRPVIATLAPLHAWYAGATVPTEFASGPFMYRIAGLLSPQEQADYETTSARSLGELLDATRPDALYVGHEGDLDREFVGYAQARRMRPVRIGKRGILYVRPRRRAAEP